MSVRYTLAATRQIEAALDYLAACSPEAARALRDRVLTVLAHLDAHPHMGHMTSLRHIRRFPLGTHPYLVDYSIDEEGITVRRFRHASRRPLA